MAEYEDREHYIPLRRSDMLEFLCRDPEFPKEEEGNFRSFCQLLTAMYHFEYHEKLEALKDAYAPFDPDSVTRPLEPIPSDQIVPRREEFYEKFRWLMERANFQKLSREQLIAATEKSSDGAVNLDINFNLFEHLDVYYRGDKEVHKKKRGTLTFWKQYDLTIPTYERVVVLLKFSEDKKLKKQLKNVNTQAVYTKIFKEIPQDDIELLLPGGKLKMPTVAQGKLGASMAAAVGTVGYKLFTTGLVLGASLVAWITPASLIGGYGYKQWAGYQTAKQSFTLQLTQTLYYLNLDNNAGVLYHLNDEAEEQECREAVLGYYYLWRYAGQEGWTSEYLDDYIEEELEKKLGILIDFEIDDALDKLETLDIVEKVGDRYRAIPLDKALEKIDYKWDNYFQYNKDFV